MSNQLFIKADKIAEELGVSKAYAYKLMQMLNGELKAQGYITISGRVSSKFFEEKFYGIKKNDRLFEITKSYLHHEMDRGSKAADVKRIRIHDLRHSHVSLLIDMGFSAVDIANRVGHESIDITFRYAHMFPTKQSEIANKLNMERSA